MSESFGSAAKRQAPASAGPDGADGSSAPREFRALLEDCAAPVRRYLFGMCCRWDAAEDMAQEALLKAWSRRESFDGRSSVRTWVFTIARNHWLDSLRRKRAAPQEETMNEQTQMPATNDPPDRAMRHGELAVAVRGAMGRLPAEQREILALRESQGLTFGQIGDLLGIPQATAKSRARYALLKLADELKDFRDHVDA